MDILFVITSALSTAIYYVYVSQTMKARANVHGGLSSTVTLAVSHLCGAALLLPLWLGIHHAETMQMSLLAPLLLAAGLLVLSRELYFYAYARTDVANITVFSALTPLYALGTGYIFLHEVPSVQALVGMLLVCASIYALFLQPLPQARLVTSLTQPFRRIGASKPVFCAFLSTIPSAFAAIFQKQLLRQLDPVSFSFFLLLLIGTAALIIAFFLFKPQALLAQLRRIPWHFFLLSALMLPLMHVAFCVVMQHRQAAVSLVLQRSSTLFQIILAYVWLRERRELGKRLLVGGGIMLGLVLIMAPS